MVEGGMAGRCEHTGGGGKKQSPICCVFNIPRLIYFLFKTKEHSQEGKSANGKGGGEEGGRKMENVQRMGDKRMTERVEIKKERTGHNGTKVYTDKNSCGDSTTG